MSRLHELRELRRNGDDRGTTMLEMVVGMALLATFLVLFTSGFLLISTTTNKVEAVTNASNQVNTAFLTLDRTIRYAAAITTPGKSTGTGDWYVEFSTTNTGSEVCTQLRVDGGALQLRTWTVSGSSYTSLSTWKPLASNVTNGTGSMTSPFTAPAASATASTSFQRLTVTLVTSSGTNTAATSTSAMTFTAVNSSSSASTSSVCTQVARP